MSIGKVTSLVINIRLVPSVEDRILESWKLLVKEFVTNIGKLKTSFLKGFDFLCVKKGFSVLFKAAYMHSGQTF